MAVPVGIIVLLDARVFLGAAQRGKTLARSVPREIRRIAALQLAGNLRVHFLCVPSENNPANAPSLHFGCGVISSVQTLKA